MGASSLESSTVYPIKCEMRFASCGGSFGDAPGSSGSDQTTGGTSSDAGGGTVDGGVLDPGSAFSFVAADNPQQIVQEQLATIPITVYETHNARK
jgi:hypothetical protein